MKTLKKLLCVALLIVGCCCTLISCSCSNTEDPVDTPPTDSSTPTEESAPDLGVADSYSVSASIIGDSEGCSVVSSTGSNSHKSGSSPVYTINVNKGYAIESVTINDATFFDYETSGYRKENLEIPFNYIGKDYSIVIKMKRLELLVNCIITCNGDGVGGTVVSSSGGDTHLGGTSPTYTITPKVGFCVYSIKVDGQSVFNYADSPEDSLDAQNYQFDQISDNHSVDVVFSKMFNPEESTFVTSYYYSSNTFADVLEKEDLISYELSESQEFIPTGISQTITLTPSKYAKIEGFKITFDGENYSELIPVTYSYNGDGFSFDKTKLSISVDYCSDKVKILTYSTPLKMNVIFYNYDTKEADNAVQVSLYHYYVLDKTIEDYNWYYSTDSKYTQVNTYQTLIPVGGIGSGDSKYLFLDDNMIITGTSNITIIYSSTKLK